MRKTVVAFFGLSVGSHAALSWMMESRADAIKIVDYDVLDASNLNRLSYGWDDIGRYKTDALFERLKIINPYVKIISATDVRKENIIKIFKGRPKISVIVDATDDMEAKLFFRKLAKEMKIPVISGADVGDNSVLDVERYDTDPHTRTFNGRIPEIDKLDWSKLGEMERKKMLIKLVGFEKNSEQMLESLHLIGKKVPTWPQMGATATLAGGIIATAIKKIVLGENIKSGRYYICLDEILVSGFNSASRKRKREKIISEIKKDMGLRNFFTRLIRSVIKL